jgi:hypothetical protein
VVLGFHSCHAMMGYSLVNVKWMWQLVSGDLFFWQNFFSISEFFLENEKKRDFLKGF